MFYDYWYIFAIISAISSIVPLAFYLKKRNQAEAQFVGALGCLGCIAAMFNIISIISGIISIISFVLKLLQNHT